MAVMLEPARETQATNQLFRKRPSRSPKRILVMLKLTTIVHNSTKRNLRMWHYSQVKLVNLVGSLLWKMSRFY